MIVTDERYVQNVRDNMNDNEIRFLQEMLTVKTIVWMPDSHTARRIKRISKHPDELDELCGFFSNGEYIALYNCTKTDFYMIHPIFS